MSDNLQSDRNVICLTLISIMSKTLDLDFRDISFVAILMCKLKLFLKLRLYCLYYFMSASIRHWKSRIRYPVNRYHVNQSSAFITIKRYSFENHYSTSTIFEYEMHFWVCYQLLQISRKDFQFSKGRQNN